VKSRLITIICIILAVATMLLTLKFDSDRGYLYASIIIIVLVIIPFYTSFEAGKPHARKVVLIAVMISLAVVSRAAFFMLPSFKPIFAFIIIAGVSLGANSGFLVGSMTAFVSNFFFGQGPWTPFQMVAWGLIGMFAGLLSNNVFRSRSIWPMVIYGVIVSYVLHGAITDLWTIFSITARPTMATVISVYGAGLWMDTILASATAIFLLLIGKPLIRKIDRVKLKYGLNED